LKLVAIVTINSNIYSSQDQWPEILFFDSSYNSNSIPQPSVTKTYSDNEDQINNSVKINGIDYYYVQASTLPTTTKDKYSLNDSDTVFVSSEESNNKIVNHSGLIDVLDFSDIKQSKYLGYGILSDKILKTYTNRELTITAELADGDDSEASQQVFTRKQTLKASRYALQLSGLVGSSVFYGRPCSFFTPLTSGSYSKVENYADPIEGIDGNVPVQYSIDSFKGYVGNADSNGFFVEYEIHQSTLHGNGAAIRVGHFESILGLTIEYTGGNLVISYCGLSSDVSVTVAYNASIKCQVGFISINGVLYANYIVKSGSTIIHNSGLKVMYNGSYGDTLLAYRILGAGYLNSTILKYLSEDVVYSNWKPTISVFVDGSLATADTETKISNVLFRHSLTKEEFNARAIEFSTTTSFITTPNPYWSYQSVRGIFDPIVLRPTEQNGFICRLDSKSANTYETQKDQTSLLSSYRVGFTYTTYKGAVYTDTYVEYSPYVESLSTPVSKELNPADPIKDTVYAASQITMEDPQIFDEPVVNVSANGGESSLEYTPSVHNISKSKQIDSIDGHFGWKISTYYQSIW